MPDDFLLPDLAPSRAEPHVYSVSEVTRAVRSTLEETIGVVWVEGEVSNYRKQATGHQYFTLKDAQSQLACVLFARTAGARRQPPLQDGMQLQVRGTMTVYEARGQYQLNVQIAQPAGAGLLQAKFEALKRRLEAEGLFDPGRKRALPQFATIVAVVTSPSGAALRDMLNVFTRRAPWLRVIISPVRVQGSGAATEIIGALAELNRWAEHGLPKPDAIIVSRGGGSIEDLWEFNDEGLARAVAASTIPVISAVGHEIDFTICDFVADLRAPTPSAAAELVVPDSADLTRRIGQWLARMQREMAAFAARERKRLTHLATGSLARAPRARLDTVAQQVDLATERLERIAREQVRTSMRRLLEGAARLREHRPDQQVALCRERAGMLRGRLAENFWRRLERIRQRLARGAEVLRLLSPAATLARGYSITQLADGSLLKSAHGLSVGTRLHTRLHDGKIASIVAEPDRDRV